MVSAESSSVGSVRLVPRDHSQHTPLDHVAFARCAGITWGSMLVEGLGRMLDRLLQAHQARAVARVAPQRAVGATQVGLGRRGDSVFIVDIAAALTTSVASHILFSLWDVFLGLDEVCVSTALFALAA